MIRNPMHNRSGGIDCEINHPVLGWIPFTARIDDAEASGREIYAAALAMGPADYVPVGDAEILQFARAAMQCTPAQMRIAMHRLGLLETVQALADADPEASIVWEYATVIVRNSPFIDALGAGVFTPDQIDDLFRAAMAV